MEKPVVKVFVAVVALCLPLSCNEKLPQNREPPELAALTFVKELGYPYSRSYCQDLALGQNDSGVDCTVRVIDSDKTFLLHCAVFGNVYWHGCFQRVTCPDPR